MVMYDNEFKTQENKIQTKDKIEPQHIHGAIYAVSAILESVNEILRCDHSNETSIAGFFNTMSFNSKYFTH